MKTLVLSSLLLLLIAHGCRTNVTYPNCNSKDIEFLDSCLLGNTVRQAIDRMDIDTSSFIPMLMFGRELHGIYIRLDDTCKITVIVKEPYIMSNEELKEIEKDGRFDINSNWKAIHRYVLDHEIVAICWRKEKARKVKVVGDRTYRPCWEY